MQHSYQSLEPTKADKLAGYAYLHVIEVDQNGYLQAVSAAAQQFLDETSALFQISDVGVLTLSDCPEFQIALVQSADRFGEVACDARYAYSAVSELGYVLHFLPRPGIGVVIVVFETHIRPPVEKVALTPRELEILSLFAKGTRRDRIAHALTVSIATVDFHAANLRKKLKAKTTTEAVAKALSGNNWLKMD